MKLHEAQADAIKYLVFPPLVYFLKEILTVYYLEAENIWDLILKKQIDGFLK